MTADETASSAAGIPLRSFYAPPDGSRDYAGIGDPGT